MYKVWHTSVVHFGSLCCCSLASLGPVMWRKQESTATSAIIQASLVSRPHGRWSSRAWTPVCTITPLVLLGPSCHHIWPRYQIHLLDCYRAVHLVLCEAPLICPLVFLGRVHSMLMVMDPWETIPPIPNPAQAAVLSEDLPIAWRRLRHPPLTQSADPQWSQITTNARSSHSSLDMANRAVRPLFLHRTASCPLPAPPPPLHPPPRPHPPPL